VLFAGTLHLHGTFFGPDLRPQDPELEARMKEVSPNVTSRTTMWKAWVGFNAILSLGLMLFGVLYGYLAVFQFQVLRQDRTLQLLAGSFWSVCLCFGSATRITSRSWYSLSLLFFMWLVPQ
jgi:hypothetical protein